MAAYSGGEEMEQEAEEMERDLPSEENKSQENLLSQKPSREIVTRHKKASKASNKLMTEN